MGHFSIIYPLSATWVVSSMPHYSVLKQERKFLLARNVSKSRRIVNSVRNKTRELENDLISNKDQSTSNEQFTYKTRSFAGPSCLKRTNFLEEKNADDNNDINDYYQIIHNSFLLQLMKQTICISCKQIWNGDLPIAKREGIVVKILVKMNQTAQMTSIRAISIKQIPRAVKRTTLHSITTKSLTKSLSTLAITPNANQLSLPLSSLSLTVKPNPLDLPHDRKYRQEIYKKLN
ncbi:unnamed protein product [Rotaria magnacalcarata]|uniref:Uncharacterized protein n=1 Tax=Rotaria magnacalcarata TaxID=392030 RepID=A0A820K962_9BILA|nr:unnamed protein product [Rotaria magnacalcarata]